MSKHNKVNKDFYVQRGRLTPDEMAREQAKQATGVRGKSSERITGTRQQKPGAAPASTRRRTAREE